MDQAFSAYEDVRHRLPAARGNAEPLYLSDLDALADQFDVFFLDAFGVLNIGESPIAGVPDRVRRLQRQGKRVLVVSNAAGAPHSVLVQKYERLGYRFAPDDVITSRKALLEALQNEPPRRWGLMADEGHGREDITHLDAVFLGDVPDEYNEVDGFLLVGSGVWTDARQAHLEASLSGNPRPVLVGNPDIVAPREHGFSIEPGKFAHRLADRTGVEPRFFGKPFANIFDLAFARLGEGYDASRILMVGDSLHTDVLGGQAAGIKSALISGFGLFAGSDARAAIELAGIRPDFVLDRP